MDRFHGGAFAPRVVSAAGDGFRDPFVDVGPAVASAGGTITFTTTPASRVTS